MRTLRARFPAQDFLFVRKFIDKPALHDGGDFASASCPQSHQRRWNMASLREVLVRRYTRIVVQDIAAAPTA